MPANPNTNKGINRLATRTSMEHLQEKAGFAPSNRTASRYNFAHSTSVLNGRAAPFVPANRAAAPAAAGAASGAQRRTRRNRRAQRKSRSQRR